MPEEETRTIRAHCYGPCKSCTGREGKTDFLTKRKTEPTEFVRALSVG